MDPITEKNEAEIEKWKKDENYLPIIEVPTDPEARELFERAMAVVAGRGYPEASAKKIVAEYGAVFILSTKEVTEPPHDEDVPMVALESHYKVVSQVRSQATRVLRAAAPYHHRRTQFVLSDQRRLLIGRPMTITQKEFVQCLPELIDKEAQGILAVYTVRGARVDLKSLLVQPTTPTPPLRASFEDTLANAQQPGELFIAPGQPGYEKQVEKQKAEETAIEEPSEVVKEEEIEEVVPGIPPTAPGPPSEEERSGAFGGPSTTDDVEEEEPSEEPAKEEETTDRDAPTNPGKKKKKNR